MKKILGISLVAMMAATAANAEIASKAYVDTNFQATSAQVESISSSSTHAQYPTAKAVWDTISTAGGSYDPAGAAATAEQNAKNYADGLASNYDAAGAATTAVNAITATGSNGVSASASNGAITVSGTAATNAAAGVIKIASAEEIAAGTSTTTAVTPAQLAAAKSAATYDDAALAGRVSTIEGSAAYTSGITSALVTQIGTNVTDIATLNGDASTSGSVAKSIADAINNLDLDNTYASAAQGALADTAVQPADIKTGTTNGTIKVGDTPVSVYGLDSAAYTASTDYLPAVASNSTATDGTYVLTMKVSGDTQVLAWETIQR